MRKKNNLQVIQIVTLILDGFMLCSCGEKATKVTAQLTSKNSNSLTGVQIYCDVCYENRDIVRAVREKGESMLKMLKKEVPIN